MIHDMLDGLGKGLNRTDDTDVSPILILDDDDIPTELIRIDSLRLQE